MAVVALTGGIGSGKSEVAKLFAQLGVPVVDTDVIAHQLTAAHQPALDEIAAQMGAAFIQPDGTLDRATLRAHVFKYPAARKTLEAILHPKIYVEALKKIADHKKNGTVYQLLVVPLLFETKHYMPISDKILAVDCEPTLQIARTMARSHLSAAAVQAIMDAQVAREVRIACADEIIENNGDINALGQKVKNLHEKFSKTYSNT